MRFLNVRSRAFVRNLYVSSLYKEMGSFLFGCFIGQSLTNMAKLSVGRLRPHFLSVCRVNYTSLNCTPGTYIRQVTCLEGGLTAYWVAFYISSMFKSPRPEQSPTSLSMECPLSSQQTVC